MTEQEKDLEVLAALKAAAYDQAPPEFWDTVEREIKAGGRLDQATDIYREILIDVMAYALTPDSPEE
jgi:predicted Zn-dependent protease with MMP-like domain